MDLAGSERGRDRDAGGEDTMTPEERRLRLRESIQINKSLSALQACVRAKALGGSSVPFRQNKLTLLLRAAFAPPPTPSGSGGADVAGAPADVVTLFLGCVSGRKQDLPDTIGTLRFCSSGIQALETERQTAELLDRPADWDRTKVAEFVTREVGESLVSAFPFTGSQLLALSSEEFLSRASSAGRRLEQRLRELEAAGNIGTTSVRQSARQNGIRPSGVPLHHANPDAAVQETIRAETQKRLSQTRRHKKALDDTRAHLLEEAERLQHIVTTLERCTAGTGAVEKADSLSTLRSWDTSAAAGLEKTAASDAGPKRVQQLLAEGRRAEKAFVSRRAELEDVGRGLIDALMERRDGLLEILSSSTSGRGRWGDLPAEVAGWLAEFEENKQSWDDFWGKR